MVSNYEDWEFFITSKKVIGNHHNFLSKEMMKMLFSLLVPCALNDSYVGTTLIPPLTVKAL